MSDPRAPDLSVVITCFKEGSLLLEAVASAESNPRGRHEIVVVDGGTDDPATLAALDGVRQRGLQVIRVPDEGPSASRNAGIRAARGRYVLPLDADNRIRPEYIDRGIDIMDADPSIDVVYGDREFFGDRTGRARIGPFHLPKLLLGNTIDTCAVIRRSAWEKVGGYDQNSPGYGIEDWDFWIRLSAEGSRFHYVDEVLFDYRLHVEARTRKLQRPGHIEPVMEYLRSKPVRMTMGQFVDFVCWDHPVAEFRAAPFRMLLRLTSRAFFPKLHARWLRFRTR